ncbi:MAG: hydroxyacid dehydrogenase [Chloroflexota bacterium]
MSAMYDTRVVVADPLSDGGLELLRREVEVVLPRGPAELRQSLPASDGLIVRSQTRVTAELLEYAGRLKIIGRAGIGVDNIDVAAATDRGILVINAPLGNVRSTAEHTIGLMFALARRVVAADRAVRDGTWKAGYQGVQLSGKRLGVIGAGKVGRQVAGMGAALGMQVAVHDPFLTDADWRSLELMPSTFADLIAESDFVSIHVPLSPQTLGLIGPGEIARMKRGAYLVNCARGGLIDEAALAAALESGHLAGAALDVFTQEPLRQSPLLAAPNVVLTPHVAASTREAQAQVSTDIALQVLNFFAGREVAFAINPAVLERADRG